MGKHRGLIVSRRQLACICYGICIFIFVLRQSEFNSINTMLNLVVSMLHGAALSVAIITLLISTKKIGAKILFVVIAIAGILALNIIKNDASIDLLYIILFMVVLKDVDEHSIYKYYFIYSVAALILVLLLFATGILPDVTLRGRHYLGFKYSSFSSNYLLHITLAFLAWKGKEIKIWHWAILEAANYYIWIMTNTTAVFILILCLPIFYYPIKIYQKSKDVFDIKIFRGLIVYSSAIFAMLTALVQILYHYNSSSAFFTKLNYFLSLRLSLTDRAFQSYPITLLGQDIKWNTWTSTVTTLSNYFYVDSSYLQIALQFGIVILVLVCLCFVYIGKYINSKRDAYVAISMLVFLFHCCTDPQLLSFRYDFFLVSVIYVYKEIRHQTKLERNT